MKQALPADVAAHYSVATDFDVRSESYGVLKAARLHIAGDWRARQGTFDDQAIFGTMRRYACACGKYVGSRYANSVCDRCGVKVTVPEVRHSRCAHLNLAVPIIHPLSHNDERISVAPVLPVSFVESPNGGDLLAAYDEILRAREESGVANAFTRLIAVLSPLLVALDRWNLAARLLVAHGMALKDRDL
jgi:hypothetical protein